MSSRRSLTSPLVWVLAVAALLVATVLLASGDTPFALDSTDDRGYRGLALLLAGFDADVTDADLDDVVSGATQTPDVVYVTSGAGVSQDVADALWDVAENGARVVVGGGLPDSGDRRGLEPVEVSLFDVPSSTWCTMADLEGISSIVPPFDAAYFDVEATDDSCLGDGSRALVARVATGEGEVIGLGSPEMFTNIEMGAPAPGEAVSFIPDNAVLAQRLLAPEGVKEVAVVRSGAVTGSIVSGQKGLGDFVSPGVKLALGELVVVALLYVWFRARRHGRPVVEARPVEVASSELVDAVGNLLERQGDPGRAAARIRHRTSVEMRRRLALPPESSVAVVATQVAARTGRDPGAVRAVLVDRAVATPSDLVDLVNELEAIRQEALHDRIPTR